MATAAAPPPFTVPPLGTVLITGGCGFLGTHIVQLLLSKNHSSINTQIHVLDLRSPSEPLSDVSYHTGDLTSSESMRELFEKLKPDVVIHTASPVFTSSKGTDAKKVKDLYYKVNVEGTRVMLEESRRVGTKAFVYTSSASVVSDNSTDLINADEQYGLVRGKLQGEYYSDTKAEAEEVTLSHNSRTPTSSSSKPFLTCAIRPAAIFGEGDRQIIPGMLAACKSGKTRFQLGDNNNLWDYTYIGNCAQAHLQAAVKLLQLHKDLDLKARAGAKVDAEGGDGDGEPRVDGEAFVITNQAPVYFWDFARFVWHSYYQVTVSLDPSTAASLKEPALSTQVFSLSREVGIAIAWLMVFFSTILGLGEATLNPARVRYSTMTRYFRSRKAEAALGYVPEVSLDAGIDRTIRWFVEQERKERDTEGKKDR